VRAAQWKAAEREQARVARVPCRGNTYYCPLLPCSAISLRIIRRRCSLRRSESDSVMPSAADFFARSESAFALDIDYFFVMSAALRYLRHSTAKGYARLCDRAASEYFEVEGSEC
jgi:hypothetical protein